MATPRVHEIATELGVDSKVVLRVLKEMGEPAKGPSSALVPPVARKVRARLRAVAEGAALAEAEAEAAEAARKAKEANRQNVRYPPARLTKAQAHAAGALTAQLPQALPELVGLLSVRPAERPEELMLAKAVAGGQLWFSPAFKSSGSKLTSLLEADLPSPTGFAYLRGPRTQERILVWVADASSIAVGVALVRVRQRAAPSPGTRLIINQLETVRAVRRGDAYAADQTGTPLGVLAAMLASIPTRGRGEHTTRPPAAHPPGSKRVPGKPGSRRVVDAAVRIIYAGRTEGWRERVAPLAHRDSHWEVRGHWRRQWHPSTSTHERIWIAEHTAGNRDAPLRKRETVNVIA